MRRFILLVLIIHIVFLFLGCNGEGETMRKPQPGDTLYTEKAAMQIYASQPKRALVIIDSAEIVGNIEPYVADMLRARVLSRSEEREQLDSARQICLALLQYDSVKTDIPNQQNVLEMLVYIARMQGDEEQRLQWAVQSANLCRQRGEEIDALRMEAEVGVILTHLGQYRQGMAKIDQVIHKTESIRHFNELDASIIAMKRKINVLDEREQFREVIPVAQRMLERLADYEKNPKDYADGTYREPMNDEERANYIDFYRAQAYGFLAEFYASLANETPTGDPSQWSKGNCMLKARHYLGLFEQTAYGRSFDGRRMIADAWCEMGEYGKVLAVYNMMERNMGTDTVNAEYVAVLRGRAVVAAEQGLYATSCGYWSRYAKLSHRVEDSLQSVKAHHYAARYHAQEQQMEIQRKNDEARRAYFVANTVVVSLLATLGFAVYFFYQRRKTHAKNRVLVGQIAEAIEYKEKYERLKALQNFGEKGHGQDVGPKTNKPIALNAMDDDQLFQHISEEIKRERLFLQPDFGRQTVMDRFHVSEHRVGAAFSQGSSHKSLPDFIRDCRLQYACMLLKDHPEMSISEVAVASGFTNPSVFSRDFKHKYTVSPTKYRGQQ